MTEDEPAAAHVPLLRVMGRADIVGMIVTGTIGAGILGLPGPLYRLLGGYCLAAVGLGGLLMGTVGLAFAEAGRRFRSQGGVQLYAATAFGPNTGFAVGWVGMLSGMFAAGAVANLALTYLAAIMPAVERPIPRIIALAALFAAIAWLHITGIRLSALAARLLMLLKFSLLLSFIILAAPHIAAFHMPPARFPGWGALGQAITLLIFALGGLEAAVIATGEMRNPTRDIPPAIFLSLTAITLVYGGVILGCMATVPNLAAATHPVYDGATRLAGPVAGAVVSLGGAVSLAGVAFAIIFSAPRNLFILAKNGELPRPLARLHPRYRTPHVAIALFTAIAFLLSIKAGFTEELAASALARLLVYGTTCLGALRLSVAGTGEVTAPVVPLWRLTVFVVGATLCTALAVNAGLHHLATLALLTIPGFALMYWERSRLPVRVQPRAGV